MLNFENRWKKFLTEQKEERLKNITWYHGGNITGDLRSLYLTPSPSISELYDGDIYSFKIHTDAKWLDLSEIQVGQLASISMDSIGYPNGYTEKYVERMKGDGYDIVWDSQDFSRGHHQIYVLNPKVLILISDK